MPILSVAEAARLANIDRGTLKRKLDKGQLSWSTRPDGTKGIELSELARLYPHAAGTATSPSSIPKLAAAEDLSSLHRDVEVLRLRQENEMLRTQLEQAHKDRDWLRGQVERLLPPPRRPLTERLAELLAKVRRR
jgi:hypothetical protein